MIFTDTTLDNMDIMSIAYLTYDISQSESYVFHQYIVPIFGDPDQMHFQVMDSV